MKGKRSNPPSTLGKGTVGLGQFINGWTVIATFLILYYLFG